MWSTEAAGGETQRQGDSKGIVGGRRCRQRRCAPKLAAVFTLALWSHVMDNVGAVCTAGAEMNGIVEAQR